MRSPASLIAAVAAVVVAGLAAGCAGPATHRPLSVNDAPVTAHPPGVQDPAAALSLPGASSCDARASLRPAGPPPPPGTVPTTPALAAIAARQRLIVGVSQNAFLFGYRDPVSNQIVGFDIDVAREIARALFGSANAIQFVTINPADRVPSVLDGRVDLVVDTLTITCSRLQQVAFSTEYLTAGERVLVKRSSGIHGMADLGGRRVCASKGGTPMLAVQKASPHPIPVGANEAVDCMVMLQQGQVDAVCNDDVLLAGLAAQDPTTQVVGPPFSDEPYGVAMSQKAPDLVRFVNAVLEKIRSDGTWASIYQHWLSPVLGAVPAPPKARYRD